MQIAQRSILVIGLCIILSFFSTFVFNEREKKLTKDWENIQAERFINKLCRTGQCSWEEYVLFFETLSRSGNKVEIRIEEYRIEQDLSKKRYYSLASWEEIKSALYERERYVFSENSIVFVEIFQWGHTLKSKSRRFGWIVAAHGNDT